MFPKAFASEFPHDNPALSDGVTWLSQSVCAGPLPCSPGVLLRAERRATAPVASAAPIASATPLSAAVAPKALGAQRGPGLRQVRRPATVAVPVAAVESEPENAFQRFLQAMVRAALDEGATQVAAELPGILAEGRLRPWTLDEGAQRALRARGYLAHDGGAASDAFVQVADAWRQVLDGTSQDLSRCGEKTLDEWGSGLLACLLGRAPQSAEELRRALRRAGVAAFGMRDAA